MFKIVVPREAEEYTTIKNTWDFCEITGKLLSLKKHICHKENRKFSKTT